MSSKWVEGIVVSQRRWSDRLYSIQVDAPVEPFKAGQFGRLALEIGGEMVARPYSFVNAPHERPLEFYYIRLDDGPLTSRLVTLASGDPIFLAPRASGFLTLSEVPPAEHLWLLSTGTALGPFLSILKTEEPWRRFSRVVLVHAVRQAWSFPIRKQSRCCSPPTPPSSLSCLSFPGRRPISRSRGESRTPFAMGASRRRAGAPHRRSRSRR